MNKVKPKQASVKNKNDHTNSLGSKIAIIIIAFIPLTVLGSLLLAFGASGIAMIFAGIAYLPIAIIVLTQSLAIGLCALGTGLLVLGLGALFLKGTIALTQACVTAISHFFGQSAPKKAEPKLSLLRIWWIFVLVFITAGITLLATGWGLGASGNYIYIDDQGIHVSQSDGNSHVISEFDLEPFSSVNISTISADIQLIPSDSFGFATKLPLDADNLNWKIENGELTLSTQQYQAWRLNIFNLDFISDYHVKIYYPANTHFERITLNSTSGNIDFDQTLVSSLIAKTPSGGISINTGKCQAVDLHTISGNITFGGDHQTPATLQINTVSGDIDINNVMWANLTAESVSGNLKIAGTAAAQTLIKSISGDVKLKSSGAASEYFYDLTSLSGDITVNGQRLGSPARPASTTSDQQIKVNTTSGNIRLDFAE
jgi:DUF4097 and DUF4098 domain-containing protein YvlB